MSKEVRIDVNQEVVNYLQRLEFEIKAREDIVRSLIMYHKNDEDASILESKVFKEYHEQMSQLKCEFALAKDEFTKNQIPEEYKKKNNIWTLDAQTNQVVITVNSECCDNKETHKCKECDAI